MKSPNQKILISACLIGKKVKYDGLDNALDSDLIRLWQSEDRLIAICPEVEGGLPVPRRPVEIQNGEGKEVLRGQAETFDNSGRNVTQAFLKGAQAALDKAKEYDIKIAILKERSPSCGVHLIYNGNFDGTRISGMGVCARLLHENGIDVFSEDDLYEVAVRLEQLDSNSLC